MNQENKQETLGILVGGGPAPGINGVIAAATIEARNRGWRVLGIREGLRWLEQADTKHVIELDIPDVSRIHRTGGSILQTSRHGNVDDPQSLENMVRSVNKLGLDALITIGGDGTAGAAAALHKALGESVRLIHVPKTIDNDIPLPGGLSTFGYQTARHYGVEVVESLMEDAKTTGRWYLVVTMGRNAGHLALGIAKAGGATLSLIPEEFPQETLRLEDIALPIEAAIARRRSEGRRDGVVVLAEGLADRLDPKDLERQEGVDRDPHGHIRLTDLPMGYFLRRHLTQTFEERGIFISLMEKKVGYELRCAGPIPFDQEYTKDLGFGAMNAIERMQSGGIVCRHMGRIVIFPFDHFKDPRTGRTKVRLVDTETESFLVATRYQLRLRREQLQSELRLKSLAKAAGLSMEECRERYLPLLRFDY
jgi:6-phosphofructokinase 1